MRRVLLILGLLALFFAEALSAAPHSPEDFLQPDRFIEIQLSPDGKHIAATAPVDGRTILVIMRLADMQLTGTFGMRGARTHVSGFAWVSNERLLIWVADRMGHFDAPVATGEIFTTNIDGSGQTILAGQRAGGANSTPAAGTRIPRRSNEAIAVYLIDRLRDNPREVLVSVWPLTSGEPYTRVERLDLHTGRRIPVARAPVQRARFSTDLEGVVRFAVGEGADNLTKTYYRPDADSEWVLLNDEGVSRRIAVPVGFSEDGATAYLEFDERQGPNIVYAMDTTTRELRPVLRGEFADPAHYLYSPRTRAFIGAVFYEGRPRLAFLDEDGEDARTYRMLEASFPGHLATVSSWSEDGNLMLVGVTSDRSPTDYFLFDAAARSANRIAGNREWIHPERTARTEPFSLKARDGLDLHGYLTIPLGMEPSNLPMVVVPHGGPFREADLWEFDEEAQLLATQGYAVLKVNFRGSGNYGRAFVLAGYRQWGQAMQDDVTDATRWAIEQGIADPSRICIYGSSYGGYAALMGAVREPTLYRCAAGNVGVYDMAMVHRRGDIRQTRLGRNILDDSLGRTDLAAISPTRHADRIQVPVFLAAGEADERAPPDHTRAMERALRQAGKPVEAHYYRGEGHGYETEAARRDYHEKLLAFLRTHLGGAAAQAP